MMTECVEADISLLQCVEILTIWELQKLCKLANHIIKLFKGSQNLSITAEWAAILVFISALSVSSLRSGIFPVSQCYITRAHSVSAGSDVHSRPLTWED